MTPDPILAELRRHRDEYAARFNYDVAAILEDLRRRHAEWDESRGTAAPTESVPAESFIDLERPVDTTSP